MDSRYLDMLPTELQLAVIEAEHLAGCEVIVVRDEKAAAFDNLLIEVHPDVGYRATISYRGERISRCMLMHEVLHLKRSWLDGKEIVVPVSEKYADEAQILNDLVAHLEIIPEERKWVESESNAHWSAAINQAISDMPIPGPRALEVDLVAFGRNVISKMILIEIALPAFDSSPLRRLLTPAQLEMGEEIVESVRATLGDAPRTLQLIGETLEYRQVGFRLYRPGLRRSVPTSAA